MPDSEAVSFCPSFNFYSTSRREETTATDAKKPQETSTSTDEVDDFQFTFVRGDCDLMADEGQIRQIFPIFNRELLVRDDMGKLCPGELESVPAGDYCEWRPKVADSSSSRCKKCNLTGSVVRKPNKQTVIMNIESKNATRWALKQWKLRDLLLLGRSNSEGAGGKEEDSAMLLSPKNNRELIKEEKQRSSTKAGKEKVKAIQEVFHVRNRAWKEGEKRKSYLPYMQDLVGFFANGKANGTYSIL